MLSNVADAGLLSAAEEAGLFSKLEASGSFSKIEKLLPLGAQQVDCSSVTPLPEGLGGGGRRARLVVRERKLETRRMRRRFKQMGPRRSASGVRCGRRVQTRWRRGRDDTRSTTSTLPESACRVCRVHS